MSQDKDNALLLALGLESDIWGDPLEALHEFLAPFEMMPDVGAQIEREFMKRESLYDVIVNRVNAFPRLLETIQYGIRHKGNMVVAVDGWQRHGKSTFGRWLARLLHRLKTGTVDGWEKHVIYEQAYSNTTSRLQEVAKQLETECAGNVVEVLKRIQVYCVIQDEQWIEHETDSKKAQDDLQNIVETCASAQIPFILVSVSHRNVGAYCRCWVVGIDAEHQLNLSFYYDRDGYCHGYLVTPNVAETSTYEPIKAAGVLEMLKSGGRKAAVIKTLTPAAAAPAEAPIRLIVEPNAEFMTILEQSARQLLTPVLKDPKHIDRWLQRYFRGLTYKDIAELEGTGVEPGSIGSFLRDQEKAISNTLLGSILEEALAAYLNARLATAPAQLASLAPTLQQTFHRVGGPGQPDVATPDGAIQVNCKLFLDHRSSWQLEARPEHTARHAWLVLAQLGPPTPTLTVYPLDPQHALLDTGSVEEVAWAAWLVELRALTGAPSASPGAAAASAPGAPGRRATRGTRRPPGPAPESASPQPNPV